MVDIINEFESWYAENTPFALATVIQTWRSAPRQAGSAMMVSMEGSMVGSVSGGCVESSVVREAQQMLQHSEKPRRLSFGVTDEDAWSVGLSCGGQIEIWLEVVAGQEHYLDLIHQIKSGVGCVVVSGLEEKKEYKAVYSPSGDMADQVLEALCRQAYQQRKTQITEGYFLNVFPARSQLVVIGAAHITLDLVRMAKFYHFETIVIDPRGIFSNAERFDIRPDQLISDWPAEVLPKLNLDADTYLVVLTHDPKIDDQALKIALDANVAYVGALGSRKTHAKRTIRLKEAGVPEEQIERIYGPVGISINARQPAEIALSIMAQIIGVRNQYL